MLDMSAHVSTTIRQAWPAPAYELACPAHETQASCDQLGATKAAVDSGCFEPEADTAEVLSAFLLKRGGTHAPRPHYVDIGCNVGAFAAQAAALGATVDCYEPTPYFVDAIRSTAERSSAPLRWNVTWAAVVADANAVTCGRNVNCSSQPATMRFAYVYWPCNVGRAADSGYKRRHGRAWWTPIISVRDILFGRHIDLLKVDIDSSEGALLGVATQMLTSKETSISTILIEIGDFDSEMAACDACRQEAPTRPSWCDASRVTVRLGRSRTFWGPVEPKCSQHNRSRSAKHPRQGDVQDIWRLTHDLGFSAYRVNIATNREIYDWRGVNLNAHMSPAQTEFFAPLYNVRGIRKLELLLPNVSLSSYPELFRWGQSLLLTKERLVDHAIKHHAIDLTLASIEGGDDLNAGNPALARR